MESVTPRIIEQTNDLLENIQAHSDIFSRVLGFASNELKVAESRKSFGRNDLFSDVDNQELHVLTQQFKDLGILHQDFSLDNIEVCKRVFYLLEHLLLQSDYAYDSKSPSNRDFISQDDLDKYDSRSKSQFFDDNENVHTKITGILSRYNKVIGRNNSIVNYSIDEFQGKLCNAIFCDVDEYIDSFCNNQLVPILKKKSIAPEDIKCLNNFLKLLFQENNITRSEYINFKENIPSLYTLYTLAEKLFEAGFFTDNNEIEDAIIDYYKSIGDLDAIERINKYSDESEQYNDSLYYIIETVQLQQWYEYTEQIHHFLQQTQELGFISYDEYTVFLEIYDDDPEYVLNEVLLIILFRTNVKDDIDLLSYLGHHLLEYFRDTNPNKYKEILSFLEFHNPAKD